MRATRRVSICLVSCVVLVSAVRGDPPYHCVDLTGIANWHYQDNYAGAANLPTGDVTLGGIPFYIPEGNNGWTSNTGSGTIAVDIPVNVPGVREVHTLINCSWGQVGPYQTGVLWGSGGVLCQGPVRQQRRPRLAQQHLDQQHQRNHHRQRVVRSDGDV